MVQNTADIDRVITLVIGVTLQKMSAYWRQRGIGAHKTKQPALRNAQNDMHPEEGKENKIKSVIKIVFIGFRVIDKW